MKKRIVIFGVIVQLVGSAAFANPGDILTKGIDRNIFPFKFTSGDMRVYYQDGKCFEETHTITDGLILGKNAGHRDDVKEVPLSKCSGYLISAEVHKLMGGKCKLSRTYGKKEVIVLSKDCSCTASTDISEKQLSYQSCIEGFPEDKRAKVLEIERSILASTPKHLGRKQPASETADNTKAASSQLTDRKDVPAESTAPPSSNDSQPVSAQNPNQ